MTSETKMAKAWVPSHITGFFAAHRHDKPHLSGAEGAGLCLSLGAATIVEPAPDLERTEILLNGKASEAPVSRFVADRLAGDRGPVRLKTKLDMPSGAGFGASGAGALGAAYALNSCFDLGLTAKQAATMAHEAEVISRTGRGDVIAQNSG